MTDRQKNFLISGIIILAIIALVEGFFLLRQSGLAGNINLAFDRALALLPGSKTDSSRLKNQPNAQEDLILQETAEDLENMQNQINRLLYEMIRNTPFARQNIGRPDRPGRQNPFATMRSETSSQPPDNIRRLQAEIAHIFQRAHASRHNNALHLLEQDWQNVGEISSMNMEEDGTNYVITVSMPGFNKTDINVSLNGRILTVEAAAEHQQAAQDSRATHSGCFKTQIMLPNDIVGESAQAFYRDGTLKITVPKKPASNSLARKVMIM
jgi:HSP20 family molecular chaperone IbpA